MGSVDALSVGDCGRSMCQRCGRWHREVVYAFPPSVIRRTVQKAKADAALCVLVVPVAVTAPHWHKLVACSVLERKPAVDGFVRVRNPRRTRDLTTRKSWQCLLATSPCGAGGLTSARRPRAQARTSAGDGRCAGVRQITPIDGGDRKAHV